MFAPPKARARTATAMTQAAQAESGGGDEYSREGGYVGFWFGEAYEDFDDTDPFSLDDSSAIAIRGGARFNRYLAGELELAILDESGHMVHFDEPDRVSAETLNYFAEYWTP